MERRRGVLVAAVVLAAAAGLLLADVEAARVETAPASTVGVSTAADPSAPPDAVYLQVRGEGWLVDSAAAALADAMRSRGVDVRAAGSLDRRYDRPVLLVGRLASPRYVPLSPRATVTWRFAYVPSGNATVARDVVRTEAVEIYSDTPPLIVDGTVELRYRARGVVSRPAYRDRIAAGVANATLSALERNAPFPGGT